MPNTVADSADNEVQWLHVVAAVIRTANDQTLLAKRPSHKHQGGKWEFPGGKVEPGELPVVALQRELDEELGICVTEAACRPLIKVRYRYPDKAVLLDVWEVLEYQGEAYGKEGQTIAHFSSDALSELDFPAANRPIISAACLPDTCLITPEINSDTGVDAFLAQLEQVLRNGVRLVQLRLKQVEEAAWNELAPQAIALVHRYGGHIILNSPHQWLPEADGLHVTSAQLHSLLERPEYLNHKWLSVSCHNASELKMAEELGADFVFLSPVKTTTSHPEAELLGWQAFAALVETVNVPVFALGGMRADDILQARRSGAQGVAAISSLWD